MARKGEKVSEETRRRMRDARIAFYQDPAKRAEQGARTRARSHGMVRTGAYNSWYAMKQRCTNPNNKYYYLYGGRGVTFDPRWIKFEGFHADMGDRPDGMTLERINPDGNYEPANCKWATWSEQRRNQRRMRAD